MHRSMLRLLAVLSLASATLADSPAPGFAAATLPGNPVYVSTTLSNGDWIGLSSSSIGHFEADGTLIQTLHNFPSSIPPESIAVDPSETFLVAGRSNGYLGGTYRVDLAGGPVTLLSFASGSSMVFETPSSVLLGVTDGFFGWQLYRLDVTTGGLTQISVQYSSVLSPIAIDGAGNLYVLFGNSSTSSYVVERFSASQLAGPALLAPGLGAIVQRGTDTDLVSALAVTPDGTTLFLAEAPLFQPDRIRQTPVSGGGAGTTILDVTNQQESLAQLQLRPATAPALFLAYQPATGGELVYQTRQSSTLRRKSLVPQRPTAAVSGPGTTGSGSFNLAVAGGPPGGTAAVVFGPFALYDPNEPAYFPGLIPIFYGLDPETARRLAVPLPLDAGGAGLGQYFKQTATVGTWAIQLAVFDTGGALVGTTTAAFL